MKLWLDAYAHLDSPLHRWEPRYKLVALLTLIFAFAFVSDLRLIPVMLTITVGLYGLSGLPLTFLATRLRYPGIFLVMVVSMLPLVVGKTVILSLGPLALRQEGLSLALLVAARFCAILTVSLLLFGTSPFLTTVRAMHALGLPHILTDMILFFYRYLGDIADSLATMQTAMRMRNFQASQLNRRNLGVYASLAGSMLVRSYEQSERVYHAMRLRGYGRAPRPRDGFQAQSRDALALYGSVLVAIGLVVTNVMLM